jgi:hypothetical protein
MSDTFTCTSNAPYDRHNYQIALKNGKKVFFENWEDAQGYWFAHSQIPDYLDVIIAKDKPKPKTKGFGQ